MRRRFVAPIGALLLLLVAAPVALATSGSTTTITGGGSDAQVATSPAVAQTFTATSTTRVDYIRIGGIHSTNANVTVSVFATANHKPTGSALASGSLTGVNASGGSYAVDLPGVHLTNGVQYAFEVLGTNGATIDATCTDNYSGGAALFQSGGSWVTKNPATVGDCAQDLSFAIVMSASPAGWLDQQQGEFAGSYSASMSFGETFTPSMTGPLSAVSLYDYGYSAAMPINLEIRTTTGGKPNGGAAPDSNNPTVQPNEQIPAYVLASATLTVGGERESRWIDFTFSSPPTLTAGTLYAIVVNGDCGWGVVNDPNAYTRGNGVQFDHGSWGPLEAGTDLVFQTFMGAGSTTPPPTVTAGEVDRGDQPIQPIFAIAALIGLAATAVVIRPQVRGRD